MAKQAGADDLAVLNPPEIKLTLAGINVVCREYGFVEELELRSISQPFIDDLIVLIGRAEMISVRDTEALVIKHISAVKVMIARSVDQPVEWVNKLNKADGKTLMDGWWSANGPFFMRCATDYARSAVVTQRLVDGLTFMQRSLQAGTKQSTSENTPTDK